MTIHVAVLGSSGMLGSAVVDALQREDAFSVIQFSRRPGGRWRYFDAQDDQYIQRIFFQKYDYVINCAGAIWQANPDRLDLGVVNARFPWVLQHQCQKAGARLIHVSTDCVFSGKKGGYTENDATDAVDDYGLSKALGEPSGAMTLRCSIIGWEHGTRRSFLEWAASNEGKQVNGYTDHVWNGVTAPEYGRIVVDIIKRNLWSPSVAHVYSTTVTKCDLLQMASNTLGLNLTVVPTASGKPVDRSLSTVKPLCADLGVPSLSTMLEGLRRKTC